MAHLTCSEIAAETTKSDGRVSLIAATSRIGAAAFVAAIEWYWYPPGTTRNRFYDCHRVEWIDTLWFVVRFPLGRLEPARRLGKQLGLRVANGVPTELVVTKNGALRPNFFPGALLPNGRDNFSMFNVENDTGSPVYQNRTRDNDAMLQASGEINVALNRGARLTPAQIADYIYGPGFPLT